MQSWRTSDQPSLLSSSLVARVSPYILDDILYSHSYLFPWRLIINASVAGRFEQETNRKLWIVKPSKSQLGSSKGTTCISSMMRVYNGFKEILNIQKFRRIVSYTGFFCFTAVVSYAYTSNTTRAGYSRADQYYASYPAGTELLTDTAKLYKAALGNCFEAEEWGPLEFCIMAKHFERQGKSPYQYHAQYMAHLLSHGQLDGSG